MTSGPDLRPAIPASADDLTPGWFSSVLGAEVEAVELERLGGLSSMVYRARLGYRAAGAAGPASVVIKLALALRAQAVLPGFDREVRFYRELAPLMNVSIPHVSLAEAGPATGNYVLVLQDFPDHIARRDDAFATPEELRSLATGIARVHAAWWDSPELAGYDFLRTFPNFIERVDTQLERCLPLFLDRFAARLSDAQRALVEALPAGFRQAVKPLEAAPVTLAHHDLSLRNVLLGNEPPVVFIDWQLTQQAPGVRDLSYMIGTCLPPERRAEEREMIGQYLAALEAQGVGGYALDQLREDYRRSVICDFGRMVMTAGWEGFSPGIEAAVAHQLACRAGSVEELDLLALLRPGGG